MAMAPSELFFAQSLLTVTPCTEERLGRAKEGGPQEFKHISSLLGVNS